MSSAKNGAVGLKWGNPSYPFWHVIAGNYGTLRLKKLDFGRDTRVLLVRASEKDSRDESSNLDITSSGETTLPAWFFTAMNTAQNPGSAIWGLLQSSTFQAVLGVLILLTMCSIAIRLVSRLRDSNTQDDQSGELLRKNFEEMRSGGDINEEEFRNITSLLAEPPRRSSTPTPKMVDSPIAPKSDEK